MNTETESTSRTPTADDPFRSQPGRAILIDAAEARASAAEGLEIDGATLARVVGNYPGLDQLLPGAPRVRALFQAGHAHVARRPKSPER
jgi:hypothetical protein